VGKDAVMRNAAEPWDPERAARRIAQLEAALMRRNELLEQKHAALCAILESDAWKFVKLCHRLRDRLLPLRSRQRQAFKFALRNGLRTARWLMGRPPSSGIHGLAAAADVELYRRWINRHEPKAAELNRQRAHRFGRTPTVSVVVPVYNPPAELLEAMARSVLSQTYANWELCLADASTVLHVRPLLERLARTDSRVRVRFLESNQGIAGNSNAALAMATGQYVALLDHDDTLAPFALYEVVSAINLHPDADFIYSDEDKIDQQGARVEPNFKPDWSPETLRHRNYICHLTVLKADLLRRIGGFRAGYDGAQDYDLVLRAIERAKRIVHVPQILYHWRMHDQSTAARLDSKDYAFDAGRKALAEHLEREGVPATVQHGTIKGTYHVIYHLPRQPLVSVIIPNRDQVGVLKNCLKSLAESSYANYEVVLVENGSTQPETFAYYEECRGRSNVRLLTWERPFNYAAVNNFAATHARGELLLFLNNDVEAINADWLERMVKFAVQPAVGAVGAKLYYGDDTIQHAGIVIGMGGIAGHSHLMFPRDAPGYMQRLLYTQNVAAVTGACLLMRRAVFEEVGGFDEGFVLAFNDVDLCLQILAKGYRVVWTPEAELYHLESKTRGPEDTPEKQARFQREFELFRNKWGDYLKAGDPYYSPHFRLDRCDYCLKVA
jgi:GT2 family glycosyltransferase